MTARGSTNKINAQNEASKGEMEMNLLFVFELSEEKQQTEFCSA